MAVGLNCQRRWVSCPPPGFHTLAYMPTHKRRRSPHAVLKRHFYRSAQGPTPADEDTWQLVFDQNAKRLFVRHEWHAARHAGTDEFTRDEFLIQRGAAPEALLALLFDQVAADA
jgi:hypothetical protein